MNKLIVYYLEVILSNLFSICLSVAIVITSGFNATFIKTVMIALAVYDLIAYIGGIIYQAAHRDNEK